MEHIKFDWFVLPFSMGLVFIIAYILYTYISWIVALPLRDKINCRKGIFSIKSIYALRDVFLEVLIHRNIFRINKRLWYMHTSIAFGWFLLIITGGLQAKLYSHSPMNLPYYAIFFRFFEHHPLLRGEKVFAFLLDLMLLIILSGISLAWIKRFKSVKLGMKKTTKLKLIDKLVMYSLWAVFPMRLLAESFTSATDGQGSFLTHTLGNLFGNLLPCDSLSYIAWWGYSLALGIFFVVLPWSRYMHIPTELFLIFLRKYGVVMRRGNDSIRSFQAASCSRCGICLDSCQLLSQAGIDKVQPAYMIREVRENCVNPATLHNCLLCGRCETVCPVGIETINIRKSKRRELAENLTSNFDYLQEEPVETKDIVYFAGCMTHLTPGIWKSMLTIFDKAGENYLFLDKDKSVCCGRPLVLAGEIFQAKRLIIYNRNLILRTKAKTLVTSCPICYKVFKDDYKLNIEVLHHSEYLLRLVNEGRISLKQTTTNMVYHDPCELGRGSTIYTQPRELIALMGSLVPVREEKESSLCCGGSLGNLEINYAEREKIIDHTIKILTEMEPEKIITACPLCKKTFTKDSPVIVEDIAQLVVQNLL